MPPVQLTAADWAVLLLYLAGIAALGLFAGRKVHGSEGYFLGGRAFSKWLMLGQTFATGTRAEMPVSLAGAVQTLGASAIWLQWKNLFATPFYWLMVPVYRRTKRTTLAEIVEDRYGPWMGACYTVFALAFFTLNMASMLKGAGKVISQATGGGIQVNHTILVMTAVFLLYSVTGGLRAAVYTEMIQGFLILTLSFLLIPLGWDLVGGLAGMRDSLAPHMFSLSTPQGIGPWFIFMLTLNGLIGIISQPHMMAVAGTGRDERACRYGFTAGNFVKRFCTIGWAVAGLMVAAMFAQGKAGMPALHEAEDAFGFACRRLLFSGGTGLMIACILAANMAGCSAFQVNSGALFTRGLYQRFWAPGRDDDHYKRAGQWSGALITAASLLYAMFFIDKVLYSFLLTETMATYVGIAIMGGFLWQRANRWGAAAGVGVAFVVNFALYARMGKRLDHWDPDVFLAALLSGTALFVAVSLLTRPEPAERTDSFYLRLADGPRLFFLDLLRPKLRPLWSAYREDWLGFLASWAIVAALLAAAWGLFSLS